MASEGGETVALDTAISPALRREGLAREVVRLVQEARKQDGFQLTDRIRLLWRADGEELAGALAEHAAFIGAEVLATGFGPQPDGAHDSRTAQRTSRMAQTTSQGCSGIMTTGLA